MLKNDLPVSRGPAAASVDRTPALRFLDMDDLPDIMALQERVYRNLNRQDLLHPLSREFMQTHLGDRGFVIGAFACTELIAFCSGYFPDVKDREWNLGYDLGLEDPDQLGRVANLQIICIHPEHRGIGLGIRMCSAVIDTIRRLNRYTHLCATISPYNRWSLNVAFHCGLTIRNLKMKYGGKLRCIAYLNLSQAVVWPENRNIIPVRLTDIARLEALLRQGYMGVRVQVVPGHVPATPLEHADGYELLLAKGCPCLPGKAIEPPFAAATDRL